MGTMRMLVESTIKDIQQILLKNRIAPEICQDIRHLLNRLLVNSCLKEENWSSPAMRSVGAENLCQAILFEISDNVAGSIVPQRRVEQLETLRDTLLNENWKLKAQVKALNAALEMISGQKRSVESAAHYSLESYFKEVFLLRQQILKLQTSGRHAPSADPLLMDSAEVDSADGATNHGGETGFLGSYLPQRTPNSRALTPSQMNPSPPMQSPSRKTSAMHAKHGLSPVESELPVTWAPDTAGFGRTSSARRLGPFPPKSDIGRATSPLASLARTANGTPMATPLPLTHSAHSHVLTGNEAAIFDYSRYLELEKTSGRTLQQQLEQLKDEYEAYKVYIAEEHEKAIGFCEVRIADKNGQIEDLTMETIDLRRAIQKHVGSCRTQLKGIREGLGFIKEQLAEFAQSLAQDLTAIQGTNNRICHQQDLLVNYVKIVSGFLGKQAISTNGPDDADQGGIGRADFQRVLFPTAEDDETQKQNKLYWRQHEVSGALVSAVATVRRTAMAFKDALKKVKLLTEPIHPSNSSGGVSVIQPPPFSFGSPAPLPRDPFSSSFAEPRCSPAEISAFSQSRAFLRSIFAKAHDTNFEIPERTRTLILDKEEKFKALLKLKNSTIFKKISRRLLNKRIRYHFEETMIAEGLDRPTLNQSLQRLREVSQDAEILLTEKCQHCDSSIETLAIELLSAMDRELIYRVESNNPRREVASGRGLGKKKSTRNQSLLPPPPTGGRVSMAVRGSVTDPSALQGGAEMNGGKIQGRSRDVSSAKPSQRGGSETGDYRQRASTASIRGSSSISQGTGVGLGPDLSSPEGMDPSPSARYPSLVPGMSPQRYPSQERPSGFYVVSEAVKLEDTGSEDGFRIQSLMPSGQTLYIPTLGGIASATTAKQSLMRLIHESAVAPPQIPHSHGSTKKPRPPTAK